MKLSVTHLTIWALAAPVATAFSSIPSPFVVHRASGSAMAMAKLDDSLAGKQQQEEAEMEAFFEDQMNADAFVDSMEEQRDSLDQYQKEQQGSKNKVSSLKMPDINVKMTDLSSNLQNWKESVDEEQVKEFMGKAGAFSKSALDFGKNALEESVELAKQAKASMSTTQVGKDKDTTYEDAWNKMGKAGMGVWSLVKDFGGFVQERAQMVDVDGLKASAESTMANLKAKKKNAASMVEDEEEI